MATGRGGAGRGQGRKAGFADRGALKRTTISLDPTTITLARAIGDGNISDGVRRAVRQCCRAQLKRNTVMLCGYCGLYWKTSDPNPPKCLMEFALEPGRAPAPTGPAVVRVYVREDGTLVPKKKGPLKGFTHESQLPPAHVKKERK